MVYCNTYVLCPYQPVVIDIRYGVYWHAYVVLPPKSASAEPTPADDAPGITTGD